MSEKATRLKMEYPDGRVREQHIMAIRKLVDEKRVAFNDFESRQKRKCNERKLNYDIHDY